MTATLVAHGLAGGYGHRILFDGLDLTVTPGRVYALLGRNGAGKSTSLKIMLGLLDPDAGERYLCGAPFTRAALAHVRCRHAAVAPRPAGPAAGRRGRDRSAPRACRR